MSGETARQARARRPTATDVARAVGVSQATVSLVLSGKDAGRVSEATRDAVLRAAASLGYEPNTAARNLRLGRADSVALVIPDIENPVFAKLLLGVSGVVRDAGYVVILFDERENPGWARSLAGGLAAGLFEGGIMHTPEAGPRSSVLRAHQPIVLIEATARGTASVQLGVADAVRDAMEHLVGLGHRRIAHVAADYAKETFELRRQTWLTAMATLGEPTHEVRATWEIEAAQGAVSELLRLSDRPTALLCDGDLLAAAAYRAARAHGLSIPGDLSVVGFDDIPLARLLDPELTTIAFPASAIGQAAGSLLLSRIAEPDEPPVRIDIRLPLQVRGSTAAVRRAGMSRSRRGD
jgi:DNA-binding LacI/PurR family transcriptional regulator